MSTANDNQIPPYLIEHLHKIAIENNFIAGEYKIIADIGSNHGDGFVASMLSVTIDGKRNGSNTKTDQLPLICKLTPTSTARQESFDTDTIFQRELFTYNVIIPAIEKFQREKAIDNNEKGFFQYPKCYAAVQDHETQQHFIIMEDLRCSGFKMINKLEPIQLDHVRLLLRALGRLHGVTMALREQHNEIWESFKPLPDIFIYLLRNKPAIRKLLLQGYDIAAELFQSNPKELAIIKRLIQTWETDLESIVKDGAAEPFTVINHGDCWVNNMVFLDNKEIRLLDFQICRMASPAVDISNFLCLCTTKEMRDQHLDEFLHIYHDSFTEIVEHFSGNGGTNTTSNFTFTELLKQFKQFGKYGLIIAVGFLKFLVVDAKDIVDPEEGSNDDEEYSFKFNDETKAKLKERLFGVLEDGIKYGWVSDDDDV